jgi:hypothetical protein
MMNLLYPPTPPGLLAHFTRHVGITGFIADLTAGPHGSYQQLFEI